MVVLSSPPRKRRSLGITESSDNCEEEEEEEEEANPALMTELSDCFWVVNSNIVIQMRHSRFRINCGLLSMHSPLSNHLFSPGSNSRDSLKNMLQILYEGVMSVSLESIIACFAVSQCLNSIFNL